MGQTDIQFKDELRKQQLMYERYKKLLLDGKTEELQEEFEKEIQRINASLQD